MGLVYDGENGLAAGTTDRSFTITPLGGAGVTPQGVLVIIASTAATDEVVGVTCDTVAMTEVPLSPVLQAGGEGGSVHAFFKGSGLTAGDQTIAVDAGASSWSAWGYLILADSNTYIHDTSTSSSTSTAAPAATLTINEPVLVFGGLYSGSNNPGSTAGAGLVVNDATSDYGTDTGAFTHGDSIKTTDFSLGWTQTADDGTVLAIAVGQIQKYQFAQAQAYIKAVGVEGFGQSQAAIKVISNAFAQANSIISNVVTFSTFAQAQADILAVGQGYAQSNADIKASLTGYAQSQADIKATLNVFAQTQGNIKATSSVFAQSQTDIKAISQGYAQGQTSIKVKNNSFAQAQATIKITVSQFAQANSDIKAIEQKFGQSQASILSSLSINSTYAQAQSIILQVYQVYSQSQGSIKQINNNFAQGQAYILLKKYVIGYSQADIVNISSVYSQAQAAILVSEYAFGQSGGSIYLIQLSSGQAQGNIRQNVNYFAFAQASILSTINSYGQAQARIPGEKEIGDFIITDRSSINLFIVDREEFQ